MVKTDVVTNHIHLPNKSQLRPLPTQRLTWLTCNQSVPLCGEIFIISQLPGLDSPSGHRSVDPGNMQLCSCWAIRG